MKSSDIKILVIDLQTYWREHVAHVLRQAGYQAVTQDTYDDALSGVREGMDWNLVLLGCACITPEERELVARLLARRQPVIVLSTTLSRQDLRGLFLQGALDVTDKTYHMAEILAIVERSLGKQAHRGRSWDLIGNGAFL
ncbi:MAG TPA: hypothetical protein VKX46_02335 [Ktedonobacteraceae bacterium]|jgi:DNA-binding response OmpR family regulator|nr:hypothetical protein [Ktedonobacteraceae bacterium]HLI68852.1 hypothetical protein [Ktedonobacteraceae bacterium]